jgi:hypothetical protein
MTTVIPTDADAPANLAMNDFPCREPATLIVSFPDSNVCIDTSHAFLTFKFREWETERVTETVFDELRDCLADADGDLDFLGLLDHDIDFEGDLDCEHVRERVRVAEIVLVELRVLEHVFDRDELELEVVDALGLFDIVQDGAILRLALDLSGGGSCCNVTDGVRDG